MADFQRKPELEQEHEIEGEDYFDYLPDPILLVIFNKLLDAKTLCRCLAVSKRFASLVPEIESISIEMNPKKAKKPIEDSAILRDGSRSQSKNFMKNLVPKFLFKPFQFLGQMILGKKLGSSGSSNDGVVDVFNWVKSALKNFNEIQSLKLELPCHGGEIGLNKTIPLLKWEAGFGKELERCLIIGANSISQRREKIKKIEESGSDENGENEQLFSDEELKMRIIWIISCLIASSARHNLLKKVVGDCPKLKNVVISDAGKQGKLCLDAGQIKELRESMENTNNVSQSVSESISISESTSRGAPQMGYVGNLVMKLWYVKELELPCSGKVMKGATLVVIRPDGGNKMGNEEREKERDWLSLRGVLVGDEIFGEAAKELLKMKEKRMYRLEMNSF